MPKEVLDAIAAIVRTEHGKWLVIENGRRMVYKEK